MKQIIISDSNPRGESTSIQEGIKRLISFYGINTKLNEVKVVNNWEKIVGKLIADDTLKVYVKKNKLYVKVSNSTIRQELSYAKEKLISLVNREVGEELVKEIVLL